MTINVQQDLILGPISMKKKRSGISRMWSEDQKGILLGQYNAIATIYPTMRSTNICNILGITTIDRQRWKKGNKGKNRIKGKRHMDVSHLIDLDVEEMVVATPSSTPTPPKSRRTEFDMLQHDVEAATTPTQYATALHQIDDQIDRLRALHLSARDAAVTSFITDAQQVFGIKLMKSPE